jgi:hypothetical protein
VVIDDALAPGAARLPATVPGAEVLGPAIGPIEVQSSNEVRA